MAVFGPYAQRADEIIGAFRRHDPGHVDRAAAVAGRVGTGMPLRPEEHT